MSKGETDELSNTSNIDRIPLVPPDLHIIAGAQQVGHGPVSVEFCQNFLLGSGAPSNRRERLSPCNPGVFPKPTPDHRSNMVTVPVFVTKNKMVSGDPDTPDSHPPKVATKVDSHA
jgi:hypothetical protein